MYCFSLICQDEDELPDLANGGGVQRISKPEPSPAQTHIQPKLPKNLVREWAFSNQCSDCRAELLLLLLMTTAELKIMGLCNSLSCDFNTYSKHLIQYKNDAYTFTMIHTVIQWN